MVTECNQSLWLWKPDHCAQVEQFGFQSARQVLIYVHQIYVKIMV